MKGIIFDFNGTMVFDNHLHEKAWIGMIKNHVPEVSEEEITNYIHGRTNDQTIAHFIGEVDSYELQQLSDEKELVYQSLVQAEEIRFVEGMRDLLNEISQKEIPYTIATASPGINIDFYFDYFALGHWFDAETIIYDNGTFPGKPDPTIYQKAAQSLGLQPEECIVIEDALTGIESANRAGIEKVIAMVYSEEQRQAIEESGLKIDDYIYNFNGFLEKYFN